MSPCAAELTETFVDLGMSPLCESYLPADAAGRRGDLLPAARAASARAACWCSCPAYVPGEDIFSDYAYFSSYSDSWVAHAKRYADAMTDQLGLGARQPGHRGGQQRRLPAAALRRRAASRCSASSRRPTSPRWPGPRGSAPRSSSSAPRPAPRWPPSTAGPTWSPATTSTRTCPTWSASPPAWPRWSSPSGLVTLEFPHLLRLIERQPVRHHLPRALPVPVAADRAAGAGHRRPGRGRRRGAAHARRFAAGARPARRRRRRAVRQRQGGARRRGRGRAAHGRGPPGLRRGGLRHQAGPARRSCSPRGPRASGSSATARRARATRCSTTAASGPTCSSTRSTAARTSRACSCRARTSRSTRPTASPQDRPDYVLVLPWNLRTEITRAAGLRARVGRPAGLPDPGPRGGRAMKVVLFCGGLGMRMREGTASAPEADDDDRRPAAAVARHALLRPLRAHRLHPVPRATARPRSRTTSCTTTRRCPTTSPSPAAAATSSCSRTDITDWNITFIDTGLHATIGERLMRVRAHVEDEAMFLANYADTLTDAPLPTRWSSASAQTDAAASMLAVPPVSTHHVRRDRRRRRPVTGVRAMPRAHASGRTAATSSCARRSSTRCATARTWCRTPSTG